MMIVLLIFWKSGNYAGIGYEPTSTARAVARFEETKKDPRAKAAYLMTCEGPQFRWEAEA